MFSIVTTKQELWDTGPDGFNVEFSLATLQDQFKHKRMMFRRSKSKRVGDFLINDNVITIVTCLL